MGRKIIPSPGEGLQYITDTSSLTLVSIKSSVATYNDLPITGNTKNDLRIVQDTNQMYTWSLDVASGNLTDWVLLGSATAVDWSDITNKPTSTVNDIDDAVTKKHERNKDTKLAEGTVNEKAVEDLIVSEANGNLKKITKLQYNIDTGEIIIFYET